MAGYHLMPITKGVLGQSSKIMEEVLELQDAETQACKIMMLVELSDIYGAIEVYLKTHFQGLDMQDLAKMSNITKRAFENGDRT